MTGKNIVSDNEGCIDQGHQELSRAIIHYVWFGLNEGHNDEEY